MSKLLLSLCLLVATTACSLDASLLNQKVAGDSEDPSEETPNPGPGVLTISQRQKVPFDFYFRMTIGFAERIAATPDAEFVFASASEADGTFPFRQDHSDAQGAVVVYRKGPTGYSEHQILRHPTPAAYNYFGKSVSATDEWLAVGTSNDRKLEDNSNETAGTGSVTLFQWNPATELWEYRQRLKAPAPHRFDYMNFGEASAISGNHLAVYTGKATAGTSASGAVFLYKLDAGTWTYLHRLTAAAPTDWREYGKGLLFFNNQLYLNEGHSDIAGRIDIFSFDGTSTWNLTESVNSPRPPGEACGRSFAAATDLLVFGCPDAAVGGKSNAGQISILKKEGGVWTDKGTASAGSDREWTFTGERVHLAGNHLFVSDGSVISGKVLHFTVGSDGILTRHSDILSSRGNYYTYFGMSFASAGNSLFISQNKDYRFQDIPGAVLTYDIAPSSTTFTQALGVEGIHTRPVSTNARLGESIAVTSQGQVLVGAPGNTYADSYPNGFSPAKSNLGTVSFYKANSDKTVTILGARANQDSNRRDENMLFGHAVSADDDVYAIGAPRGQTWVSGMKELGFVSINYANIYYDSYASGGNQMAIFPDDPEDAVNSRFGEAVKIAGTKLLVGAPEHKVSTATKYGKVYLLSFDILNWSPTFVTTVDAGTFKTADMRFGASLDYASNTVVVGAPGASQTPDSVHSAAAAGGVWIYNYDGTTATLQNILMGSQIFKADGSVHAAGSTSTWQAGDGFGTTVLASGSQIFVGSPGASSGAGAVFVYKYNSVSSNYDFVERLDMTGCPGQVATPNAGFGYSLAVMNNSLAVGAPEEDTDADHANSLAAAGAVYIFESSSAGLQCKKKLTPTGSGSRTAGSLFGRSLAYKNSALYVGSPGHSLDENGTNSVAGAGAFFVFEVTGN